MIPRRRRSRRRGGGFSLAYKGHGVVFLDTSTGPTTLNYGTVSGGSAPAAGDLVVWVWFFGAELYDTSPLRDWRRQNLAGAGWAQANQPAIPGAVDTATFSVTSMLAKVVSAGDISSPPTIQPTANYTANYGMWTAYTVTGAIGSVSIPAFSRNSAGSSAPSNIAIDSSVLTAPALSIAGVIAAGTDNSISLSGITLDREVTQNELGQYYTATLDLRVGVKLDIGGAAYTIGKGDDGAGNLLAAGYVQVT